MSPERCTGIAARWCPVCGDCTCKAPHPDIRDYTLYDLHNAILSRYLEAGCPNLNPEVP